MICCICGDKIQDDEFVLRLTAYRYSEAPGKLDYHLLRSKFDDGSDERFTHYICPIEAGAPMSLIGADGERSDV